MSVDVQPLSLAHIPALMALEKRAFAPSVCEDQAIYEQRIALFEAGNLGFFHDQRLIGFFCSELWGYQQSYEKDRFALSHSPGLFHCSLGTELYISSFAVDANQRTVLRGKKAFSLAMEYIQKRVAIQSAVLVVSEKWEAAKALYRWWGFTEIGSLEKGLGDDTALIMRCESLS